MKLRTQEGQAQLLSVLMLSSTLLATGLYTLDRAQKTQETAIKSARVTEMRKALENAVQRASAIYRNEAACDPVLLHNKLNGIQPDGSILPNVPTARVLNVTLNSRVYEVSFGAVTPIPWVAPDTDPSLDPAGVPITVGTSQDAELEVWTSTPNSERTGGQKTSLRAVLINTCQIRCDSILPRTTTTQAVGEVCGAASNGALSLRARTVVPLPAFAAGRLPAGGVARIVSDRTAIPCGPAPARRLGDVPISPIYDPASDNGVVNALDYAVLTQYLQQRDANWLTSTTALNPSGTSPSCGDLNLDDRLDELDRTLLLKYLRGYLYRIPTHPDF
jgi:hypothetical protein